MTDWIALLRGVNVGGVTIKSAAPRETFTGLGIIDALPDALGKPDADVDPLERGEGIVYWNPVRGTTVDTPFAKVLAKPVFKPTTTNRNLRTLETLLA